MIVKYHFVIGVIAAVIVLVFFNDPIVSAFFFVSNSFIDADHFLDYWIHKRIFKINFKDFIKMCKEYRVTKVVILFHSYELIVTFLLILLFWYNKPLMGIAMGMSLHIFTDVLSNPIFFYSYFFTFRVLCKFNHSKIYKL